MQTTKALSNIQFNLNSLDNALNNVFEKQKTQFAKALAKRLKARQKSRENKIFEQICYQEALEAVLVPQSVISEILDFIFTDKVERKYQKTDLANALEYLIIGSVSKYCRRLFKDINQSKAHELTQSLDVLNTEELAAFRFHLFKLKFFWLEKQEKLQQEAFKIVIIFALLNISNSASIIFLQEVSIKKCFFF